MIIHDVEQNTPEWHALRLGIPTASNFKKLVSPTGQISKQADAYMDELLAEMMTGEFDDIDNKTGYMQRGHDLEDQAAQLYAFKHDVELTKAGFVTDDARTMGCSPDMLIMDKGGLEIKSFKPGNHVAQLLNPTLDEAHKPQIQGSLLVLGWEWWDAISFHPKMEPVIIRSYRDEGFISLLRRQIVEFHQKMEAKKQKLIKLGCEFYG